VLITCDRDVRKIIPLLDALATLQKPFQYLALDLSRAVLEENIQPLKHRYPDDRICGLWGTFDDALAWLKSIPSPKCYISMGSMFGNDHFDAAVSRLKAWRNLMNSSDLMLLGLDSCQDRDTVWKSYHDKEGLFQVFIRNGFRHSNSILGHEWYRDEDWDLSGEIQDAPRMHQFVFVANKAVRCRPLGIDFRPGEKVVCYEGFKYEPRTMQKQFSVAGLTQLDQWCSPSGLIFQYLLQATKCDA